jgi:hypothetical protein
MKLLKIILLITIFLSNSLFSSSNDNGKVVPSVVPISWLKQNLTRIMQ